MAIFTGTDFGDILFGGFGIDALFGFGGTDYLVGSGDNGGTDYLYGMEGNDHYFVDSSDQVFENEDEGIDSVYTSIRSYVLPANVENLYFNGGNNYTVYTGHGNELDNTITGTNVSDDLLGWEGDDILIGYGGHDRLHGGEGNDRLEGGDGDDLLLGLSGSDELIGGEGDDLLNGSGISGSSLRSEFDVLTGGGGRDIFVLGEFGGEVYRGAGYATITDYDPYIDQIQVRGEASDYFLIKGFNVTGSPAKDTIIYTTLFSNFSYGSHSSDPYDAVGVVKDSTDILLSESYFNFTG